MLLNKLTCPQRLGTHKRVQVAPKRVTRSATGNGSAPSGLDEPIELHNGKVVSGPDLSVTGTLTIIAACFLVIFEIALPLTTILSSWTVNGLHLPNPFIIGSGKHE